MTIQKKKNKKVFLISGITLEYSFFFLIIQSFTAFIY